jgi:hypothetical protein
VESFAQVSVLAANHRQARSQLGVDKSAKKSNQPAGDPRAQD